MFDTYYATPDRRAQDVTMRVVCTEKRAPTDESVRLLREMQQEAKNDLIASIKLDSNHLKGIAHVYRDVLSAGKRVMVIFELNGKKVQHESLIREWLPVDEIGPHLIRELSETIAREVLLSSFTNEQFAELFRK